MPPKSSNKKTAATSWFCCENCGVYITSKARDSHENVCPIVENAVLSETNNQPLEYIRSGRLYTTDFLRRTFEIEELKEQSTKFLNNLIFMSESAIRLCGFHIGQSVQILILSSDKHTTNYVPVVRSVWPIPEKFLTTIFVSAEDYDTNWQEFKGGAFIIEALPKDSLSPAKTVSLELQYIDSEEKLNAKQITDLSHLLKFQMKDLVYTNGSLIFFDFFNWKLKFKVLSCTYIVESLMNNESKLEKAFETLSITQNLKFYTVINSSKIQVEHAETEDTQKKNLALEEQAITKADIGGVDKQMALIEESMNQALGLQKPPKGIKVSRGILLYGSSGCGKTMLCEAMVTIARSSLESVRIIKINASEIFSRFLGETEKNLATQFGKAYENFPKPSLIIVEDVHNLCPKDETNDISKRVSIAFANMLDDLYNRIDANRTFLLATTCALDAINPTIRRCGRFDVEIEIGAPSPKGRAEILHCVLRNVAHDLTTQDVEEVAQTTHGFVGADLVNLISNATLAAHNCGKSIVNVNDVFNALTQVKPSAMREVLIENPNVHWSDIGGQADLKLQLKQAIEWPLLYPEKFKRLGIKPPRGILMYGPPGCSKTMIAKALATESQLNFLSIKGPELFSMWVGESERAVREVFRKARQVAPSIVFFDEIDAIGGERSENNGSSGGSSVQERVLTQLLTELDGVEALQNVTIVAATNRPDMIDKALLRPGRIDRIVYVGLPDEEARREIFSIKLASMPLASDVNIEVLVKNTDRYTGAEIQAVCHEAALRTLEQNLDAENVCWEHFMFALENVRPRTSSDLLQLYQDYATRI